MCVCYTKMDILFICLQSEHSSLLQNLFQKPWGYFSASNGNSTLLAPSQPSWWIALLSLGEWQEQLPFKP